MRQRSGLLNRAWLAVIGLLVLLAGIVAALIALGLLARIFTAIGIRLGVPVMSSKVLGSGVGAFFDRPVVVVAVGLLGVILGVIGLAWLIAQIPRTNAAKPFRLQDDAARGLTICRADVLTDAVEADAERLLGVVDASAVLRGTARQPELTLKVTVNDRTDVQRLLHSLQAETAARLVSVIETPLKHLAVQVDVTTSRHTADRITV
jgi:hypothetical protein